MTKNINTIHVYFGRSPDITDGGDVDYDDPQISSEMRATSSISPQNVTTDTDDKEPSISGNDNTEDVSKIVTIKLEKNSTINKSSNNNPNSTSIEKIDVKHTDTETQAKEKESTKLTDSSNTEQRKPKLSFRFRSRRPSTMESNKESSSSPVDLSAPSDVQERKNFYSC